MRYTTGPLRHFYVRFLSLAMALAATTCGDPTAPQIGTSYGLWSINGRRAPTWDSKAPPTDSTFSAIVYEEYRIISDSEVVHNLWLGRGHLNPDSTVGYSVSACYKGWQLHYRTSRDTLFLTANPLDPFIPHTQSLLRAKGTGFTVDSLASADGLTYRYVPANPTARSCGGV